MGPVKPRDHVAVVTGGGSGIGKAAALALSNAGYSIVVAGRRAEAIDAVAREGSVQGGRWLGVVADITDPLSVRALFEKVKDALEGWTSYSTTPVSAGRRCHSKI